MQLAKSPAAAAGDLDTALRELAKAAAASLQVERASLWLYDDARSRIECVELYQRGGDLHSRGLTLSAADYPAYFRALEEERAIVAHDAHADPRTREFSASYLTPLGIVAMLDAPVRLRGRMVGVVCHEHVGEPRRWTLEEQSFAASIADLAALALEARERRRTEERLREQAQILDYAYDAILVRDLEGHVLSWNHGAEELYGWKAAEATGQTVHGLLRTQFPKPRRQIEMMLLRTGRWEGELKSVRRDGRALVVASRWALLRNERGDAAAVLEIGRDITERKLREEALRESDERFRQLAENIDAVFYITQGMNDESPGKLVYVSPAYERVWGFPAEALYERPRAWLDAVHPEDRPRIDEALRHVSRGDFDQEFRILHPGGEVRWVRSRSFPVRDAAGNIYRNAGIAEDITARRNAEDALRQAKEEAEVANRAKDDFLAALSHELRTPLTPVLALVSGLQTEPGLPARTRKALATIRRNVELEARLIDDLLDLTRISRGKLELRREVIDLRQALDHALDICAPEAAAKGIRIDLTAGEHRVWADAPRLTQVFLNLLNNAVKFTPKGGEIRVAIRDEGERELCGRDRRQRHRHRARPAAARLPGLPAGGPAAFAALRRPGAGARHQPRDRRDARRHPERGERRPQPRRDLHPPPPGPCRGGRRRRGKPRSRQVHSQIGN